MVVPLAALGALGNKKKPQKLRTTQALVSLILLAKLSCKTVVTSWNAVYTITYAINVVSVSSSAIDKQGHVCDQVCGVGRSALGM